MYICVDVKAHHKTCVSYCDGCVMVAWAGDGAVRDNLLVQQRRAPLWLGLGAVLRQVVIVDLILFIRNLFAEPEGTTEVGQAGNLLTATHLISHQDKVFSKTCVRCVCRLFMVLLWLTYVPGGLYLICGKPEITIMVFRQSLQIGSIYMSAYETATSLHFIYILGKQVNVISASLFLNSTSGNHGKI